MSGRHAHVPEFVVRARVSPAAMALYVAMALECDYRTREITYARETLAERIGMSVASVKRAIAELVEAGALEVTARRFGRRQGSNLYRLPLQRLTGEPLMDEPLKARACGSPVTPISVDLPEDAACRGVASASPEAQPLPMEVPEEPAMGVLEQSCMNAAVASARRERDAGKRITAIGKYAAPRGREWAALYRTELEALLAAGATGPDLEAWLGEHADPTLQRPASTDGSWAQAAPPRLQDLTGLAVQQEFVEPQADVVSLAGARAALREARAAVASRSKVVGSERW